MVSNAGTIITSRVGAEDAFHLARDFAPVFAAADVIRNNRGIHGYSPRHIKTLDVCRNFANHKDNLEDTRATLLIWEEIMDFGMSVEALKLTVPVVSALAELAQKAKDSKNPSVPEVMYKLKGEAVNIGRGLDRTLDQLSKDLDSLGIDTRFGIRKADEQISGWNLLKRVQLSRVTARLWRIASAVKDFYADIERLFACAEAQQALAGGVKRAYEVREQLSKVMTDDAPLKEVLHVMRQSVQDALKILEA
jgi:hypothetical protein